MYLYTLKKNQMIKRPLLTLILFFSCLAGIAQEPVEVMVLMKDQYNRTELCRKAEFVPTRAARRDYVVKELQTFAVEEHIDIEEGPSNASIPRVFDATGRIVNTSNLSPGVYIIQRVEGNRVKNQKIVIR